LVDTPIRCQDSLALHGNLEEEIYMEHTLRIEKIFRERSDTGVQYST